MNAKNFLEKAWLTVSPTYKKVDNISSQLDSLSPDLLKQSIRDGKVYIDDYSDYAPKHRASLETSRIGEL